MAVPTPSTTFSQAQVNQTFVATLEDRRAEVIDSTFLESPTLNLLKDKIKSTSGQAIRINVQLKEANNTGYTDDNGSYDTAITDDTLQSVLINWPKMIRTNTTLPHRDLEMNQGVNGLVDLIKHYVGVAERSHARFVRNALWEETGWVDNGNKVNPLTKIIDDVVTLHGLSPAEWPLWKSHCLTIDVNAGDTIIGKMEELTDSILAATGVKPKHWIIGAVAWAGLRAEVRAENQNIESRSKAQELTFEEFEWMGYRIRPDYDAPEDLILAINEDYLELHKLNDEFFKPIKPTGNGTNAGTLNVTQLIVSSFQIGTSKRNAHGKITGVFKKDPVVVDPEA